MVRLTRTYRGLTALALAGLGAAATAVAHAPGAGAAAIFGAQPLPDDSTVALAQPVDGNRWNLVVVERLQSGSSCWLRQANGLVSLEADAFNNDALCNRLQSSSGYSLRAGGQDLRAPWRLRIEASGNRLELQALNPSLPGTVVVGTAPLAAVNPGDPLPAFTLNPGWSFQKRSYAGRLLSHVYLSTRDPLAVLQARARGTTTAAEPPSALPPIAANTSKTSASAPTSQRNREPMAGQVISLQVVPYRDNGDLTASNQ